MQEIPKLFTRDLIEKMSDEEIASLAQESGRNSNEREYTMRKKKALETALGELMGLKGIQQRLRRASYSDSDSD